MRKLLLYKKNKYFCIAFTVLFIYFIYGITTDNSHLQRTLYTISQVTYVNDQDNQFDTSLQLQIQKDQLAVTENNAFHIVDSTTSLIPNTISRTSLLSTDGPGTSFFPTVDSSIYKLTPGQLMIMPKLDFLPAFKNPCFLVRDPPPGDKGVRVANDTVLKCWPYFQLIGVEKSGTSDFFDKLNVHQHVLPMIMDDGKIRKEPLFFNGIYGRDIHNNTIGGYLRLMDDSVHVMNKQCPEAFNMSETPDTPCPYLMFDCSARTMNFNDFWFNDIGNENQTEPKILVPHKIHRIYPETKIIAMLRNPVTRLFSDYKYYNVRANYTSAEDFHVRVTEAIAMWNLCTTTLRSELRCAFGRNWDPIKPGIYWNHNSTDKLRIGIYSIYLEAWLQLFPKENIHVIKMEDYSVNPKEYVEKHILPFLGLEPYDEEALQKLQESKDEKKNENNKIHFSMLDSTRKILEQFYSPYNKRLARLLDDDRFLWT